MNRSIRSFNNEIQDTFALMRISSRQKLVGSSSVIGNIITNDYDLNEMVIEKGNEVEIINKIYMIFKTKFKLAYKTKDTWIVDFKCGMMNDEPIRWNRSDINRGRYGDIKFIDAILTGKCKIDIVQYLNGRFIEISEIYYFNINGKKNYNDNEFDKQNILYELEQDKIKFINDGNIFKALKREYRILDILGKSKKRQSKLDSIFNSPLGWLYYCISNIKTILIMKEQSFRKVPFDIFMTVQQTIKDDIGKVIDYPYSIEVLDNRSTITQLNRIVEYLLIKLKIKISTLI